MIEIEHIWPVASILPTLSFHGGRCEHINARAPWCLHRSELRGQFHLYCVRDGHGRLAVNGEASRSLRGGDIVLVPGCRSHWFMDQGESVRVLYAQLTGAGAIQRLPSATLVNINERTLPEPVPQMIKLIMWELCGMAENCASVVAHLIELLAMYMLRTALRQTGAPIAHHCTDGQIGKALELLRSRPEQPWTLNSLAAEVAMSRSAFATHFRRAVGQTPMHFLARERMHLAAKWIQEGKCKIGDIAERLDYHSEAAFQRAFKRHMGLTPGAIRRSPR